MTSPFLAPSRDPAAPRGRGARSGETYLSIPGVMLVSTSALSLVLDTDIYQAFYVDTPIVVDQLVAEVSTGTTGNMRIGLYAADRSFQPIGAPLADSGSIDTSSTGVKTYTPSTPVYLPRGRYLTVVNASANGALLTGLRGGLPGLVVDSTLSTVPFFNSFRVSRTYAAFPTPGTAWDTEGSTGNVPQPYAVFLRVSAP